VTLMVPNYRSAPLIPEGGLDDDRLAGLLAERNASRRVDD